MSVGALRPPSPRCTVCTFTECAVGLGFLACSFSVRGRQIISVSLSAFFQHCKASPRLPVLPTNPDCPLPSAEAAGTGVGGVGRTRGRGWGHRVCVCVTRQLTEEAVPAV